jgi:hypothetical protein
MTLQTYLAIAAIVLVALILGMVLARWLATHATAKVILDVEKEAWEKLDELLEFVASSKSDQQAIAAAQRRIANRAQQVADFKAKVASL